MVYLFGFLVGAMGAPWLPPNISPLILLSLGLVFAGVGRLLHSGTVLRGSHGALVSNRAAIKKATARKAPIKVTLISIGMALLGAQVNYWHIAYLANQQLPHELEKQEARLTFEVQSLPRRSVRSVKFFARVQKVACDGAGCEPLKRALTHQLVQLSWYRPFKPIQPGGIYTANVRVKRPRAFANPVGPDYHAWLLSQGVIATGYLKQGPEHVGHSKNLSYWRAKVAKNLFREEADYPSQRFLKALLVGDKREITPRDWEVLQKTGVIHLMAISGLHIGLVATLGFFIGAVAARAFVFIRANANTRVYHMLPPVLSMAAALGYSALAGFSLPTLRALVACVCVNGFLLGARKAPAGLVLAVCIIGVLAVQPMAPMTAGFWLSFGAVATLLFLLVGRGKSRYQWLSIQAGLGVFMIPLLLSSGIGASLISPVVNLVAVPWVSFLVVPGLLASALIDGIAPGVGEAILWGVDGAFGLLWRLLDWAAEHANLWWPSQPLQSVRLVLFGVAAALAFVPFAGVLRPLAVIVALAALWAPAKPSYALKLTVMDVGQGLSVVIQTPNHAWVYDVGAEFSPSFSVGKQLVMPYLRQQGIRSANLIVSHNDADHAGGAQSLIRSFKVEQLISGEPMQLAGMARSACEAGQEWAADDVTLKVVWPQEANHKPRALGESGNHHSCVVLVTLQVPGQEPVRILLPGDIHKRQELALLPLFGEAFGPLEVLVAAHHGSKTSSSLAFINRLQPKHVAFSAGHLSRYRHPNPQVVQRFERLGAKIWRTAEHGAITWQWNDLGELSLSAERLNNRRLWH